MEINRGRDERREVSVYDDLYSIDKQEWFGIQQIVKITRVVYHKDVLEPAIEAAFYISSKKMTAQEYNKGIRSHWSIENSLHYVKDVTFAEDASLIRTGNAPANFSIIRNIAINTLKKAKFHGFAQAIRMLGGDIRSLAKLLA